MPVGSAPALLLRPLTTGDERAARDGHEAMRADGFTFLLGFDPARAWAEFVAAQERVRRGDGLAPGQVPATFLLAEVDGAVVGRTSIRHVLTPELTAHGGHIGYGVLSPYRRRGYAVEMLRQSLVLARSYGVRDALITCDDDNLGSIRTIERCGGVRDADWPTTRVDDGTSVRRYWVPAAAAA